MTNSKLFFVYSYYKHVNQNGPANTVTAGISDLTFTQISLDPKPKHHLAENFINRLVLGSVYFCTKIELL